jgi:hypothetical protein
MSLSILRVGVYLRSLSIGLRKTLTTPNMLDTIQAHHSQHPLRFKNTLPLQPLHHVHHNQNLQMLKNSNEPTSHQE